MTEQAKDYVRFSPGELVYCHCGSGRKRGWWKAHCAGCECKMTTNWNEAKGKFDVTIEYEFARPSPLVSVIRERYSRQ